MKKDIGEWLASVGRKAQVMESGDLKTVNNLTASEQAQLARWFRDPAGELYLKVLLDSWRQTAYEMPSSASESLEYSAGAVSGRRAAWRQALQLSMCPIGKEEQNED